LDRNKHARYFNRTGNAGSFAGLLICKGETQAGGTSAGGVAGDAYHGNDLL
jgi:hypothetical protein